MTTFTSDDREEAYKKILEEAPAHIGYEDAVPIPHNGLASKELTDKEIMDLWHEYLCDDILVFARAILQKAKEK
jgi:hypothetical protein